MTNHIDMLFAMDNGKEYSPPANYLYDNQDDAFDAVWHTMYNVNSAQVYIFDTIGDPVRYQRKH